MSEHRRTTLALVFAILLPATVLLIRVNFGEAADGRPALIFFIIPIMLCAYLSGLLPGFLCTAFSTLLSVFFLIARDMTDRRAVEQALRERDAAEQASRLKSEFLATMSHELRTPLTGVIGFAEYLRAGQAGPINGEQTECLDSVHASSLHLLELINGILDLSKIEAGKMELTPETFSVRAAVGEAYGVVLPMASKKGIWLEQRVADELDNVMLDRVKFMQVLYNLLSNGVKFTDAGGRVDVDVDIPENRRLRIRVADTGIGICAADIDRLFKNFHQLDSGDARRNEGTGLGLALTRKIVELQKGIVTVESTPGQGSAFTVMLPY